MTGQVRGVTAEYPIGQVDASYVKRARAALKELLGGAMDAFGPHGFSWFGRDNRTEKLVLWFKGMHGFFRLHPNEINDGGQEQVGESDHKTISRPLSSRRSIIGGTDPIVGPRPITAYVGTGKNSCRSRKNQPEYPGIRIKYSRVLQKDSDLCDNEQATQPKDEGVSHKDHAPF